MRVFLTTALIFSSILSAQQVTPPPKQAPFLVKVSAPLGDAAVGSDLIVSLTFTSTSPDPVFLPRIAGKLALDLFVKLDVRDHDGKPVPETPERIKARHMPLRPWHPRPALKPGDSELAEIILSQDYDLSKPGAYSVQATATDPASQAAATSNMLTVNVLPPKDK